MPEEFRAPVPSAGIFDSPTVVVCINSEWVSHIDGAIQKLLNQAYWDGDDDQTYAATQEVQKLLVALAQIGTCP